MEKYAGLMAYINHDEFVSNMGFPLQFADLLLFLVTKQINNSNLEDLLKVNKAGDLTLWHCASFLCEWRRTLPNMKGSCKRVD
jgi:hypothetical protein